MGGVMSPFPSGVVRSDTVRGEIGIAGVVGEIGDARGDQCGEDEEHLLLFPYDPGIFLLGDRELDLLLLDSGVGYTGCHEENGVLGDGGE